MKFPGLRLLCYTLCLLPLTTPSPESRAQTKARRPAPVSDVVIFAVEKHDMTQMEPVVIIRGNAFVKPPIDESDVAGGNIEARAKRFIADYFRAGRRYRLLFGGGDAGSVTVRKYIEPGCVGMYAEVAVETQARLGGEVQALAVSSETLGRGTGLRRVPTETERAAALELARAAYVRNKVSDALVKTMKVNNLTATDLNRDGKAELIGSFLIEVLGSANAPVYDNYSLFMILEPTGNKHRAAMTWFHKGGEADSAYRRLVDQVDLDGDGVSEVIAEGTYYESNDYIIYKKQQGTWRSVYQGGGGGC